MIISQQIKLFSQFISTFWKFTAMSNILKEKMGPIADLFSKLQTANSGLEKRLRRPVSQHYWRASMLKGPKHC